MSLLKKLQVMNDNLLWQRDYEYNFDDYLYQQYKNDKISLVVDKSGFIDSYDKEFIKFDLKSEKLWCTYQKCIMGELKIENDQLEVKIRCYKGDMLDGNPTDCRWIAVFLLDFSHVSVFKKLINDYWNHHLEHEFLQEEAKKKKIKIKQIEERLLK